MQNKTLAKLSIGDYLFYIDSQYTLDEGRPAVSKTLITELSIDRDGDLKINDPKYNNGVLVPKALINGCSVKRGEREFWFSDESLIRPLAQKAILERMQYHENKKKDADKAICKLREIYWDFLN